MASKPKTVMDGLKNRRATSFTGKRNEVVDIPTLRNTIETLVKEKSELEVRLKSAEKDKKRLVQKCEEIIAEKQELEKSLRTKIDEIIIDKQKLETSLKTKNDLLTLKPKAKKPGFISGMQEKLKNRPTLDAVKKTKIYKNESCFNTDLVNVIMHELHPCVPKVLVECVKFLETKPAYMKQIGLYRASGNHAIIQTLRYKVDANDYKLLHKQTDPHNITGLVKLFFRELKSPLISLEHIEKAIPDSGFFFGMDEKLQVAEVEYMLKNLPNHNKETLKFFMEHISRVAVISENEMNIHSLSIVTGACICYETMQSHDTYLLPNRCIELMISHFYEIFK